MLFLVLYLGIWWRHETWVSKILKFDFLENRKSFWSETKNLSWFRQVFLSFARQKNVVAGRVRQVVFLYNNDCMEVVVWAGVTVLASTQASYTKINESHIFYEFLS